MNDRIRYLVHIVATIILLINSMILWSSNDRQNNSFHFGFFGGYSQNRQLSGDIYTGLNVYTDKKLSEVNLGPVLPDVL